LQIFYAVNYNTEDGGPDISRLGTYIAENQIYSQMRWAINGFITAIVVSHFVKVYREKGNGKFEVSDVSKSILRDFVGNTLAFIILFFAVALVSVILFYVIYSLAQISITAAILIFFSLGLAYFLLRFPFWYFVFSVFVARTSSVKNLNVFAAMGLAGRVFSGKYWLTWVIMFCMWMLLYIVGTCIAMPASILAGVAQLSSLTISEKSVDYRLIESILLSLAEFGKTIVNSIFCLSVALHFYGLKERVDGEGTKQVVEMIGTKNEDEGIELTY
jgi:hypothetical protein